MTIADSEHGYRQLGCFSSALEGAIAYAQFLRSSMGEMEADEKALKSHTRCCTQMVGLTRADRLASVETAEADALMDDLRPAADGSALSSSLQLTPDASARELAQPSKVESGPRNTAPDGSRLHLSRRSATGYRGVTKRSALSGSCSKAGSVFCEVQQPLAGLY